MTRLSANDRLIDSRARRKVVLVAIGLTVVLGTGLLPSPIAPQAQATFPGRAGAIAFASLQGPCVTNGPLCDWDIFSVEPNGAAIQQLTQGPNIDLQPNWSPDGQWIVFASLDPWFVTSDIWVMERDGTGLTNLTGDAISDYTPAWSPKGDKIIFARRTPTVTDVNLHVMNADGTGVVQLTDTPGIETDAEWSPDGRLIVFAHSREANEVPGTGPGPLELIRPDGSGRRVLESSGSGPHWSPDGKEILFGSGGGGNRDIWVVRRDGTHPRNLTADSDADELFGVWSPDGKRIAFLSNRDGAYKIYTMRSDGTHPVLLIDIELNAREAQLDWGPRP